MKVRSFLLAASIYCLGATAASATLLPPGTKLIPFTQFLAATQGTELASKLVSGSALTFSGDTRLAVYRNTLGTLDFYYQFSRTGAGSAGSSEAVETLTGGNFAGFTIDAMFTDLDPDLAGLFTVSNNPGTPATAQRNLAGSVIGVDFAPLNPIENTETSATYIFRTNATFFTPGTFGVIDGSTLQGVGYQPSAGPVPETATWAMMVIGFGALGSGLRFTRKSRVAIA